MKFESGDVVRVVSGKKKGLSGVIAGQEPWIVRKIARTDYMVIMHGSLEACTFKENELEHFTRGPGLNVL